MGMMNELDIEKSLREEAINQCREDGSALEPTYFRGQDGVDHNLDATIKEISSQEYHKPGVRRITEREFDNLVDKHGNAAIVYKIYGISPEDIDYGDESIIEKQSVVRSMGEASLATTVSPKSNRRRRSTRRSAEISPSLSDYGIPDEVFALKNNNEEEDSETIQPIEDKNKELPQRPVPTDEELEANVAQLSKALKMTEDEARKMFKIT